MLHYYYWIIKQSTKFANHSWRNVFIIALLKQGINFVLDSPKQDIKFMIDLPKQDSKFVSDVPYCSTK